MIYTDLYKQFNEQFWNFFLNSELARNQAVHEHHPPCAAAVRASVRTGEERG